MTEESRLPSVTYPCQRFGWAVVSLVVSEIECHERDCGARKENRRIDSNSPTGRAGSIPLTFELSHWKDELYAARRINQKGIAT